MFNKLSRLLILFHIFIYSTVIELADITNLIKADRKTIMRDIKELQEAGLLRISFSRKAGGYVHIEDHNRFPFRNPVYTDNKAKGLRYRKLIRLASIMIELRYHRELPWYDINSENQETCSSWYKRRFPGISLRTMQRDFNELRSIGYEVDYDPFDKCYTIDFPEDLDGIISRLD